LPLLFVNLNEKNLFKLIEDMNFDSTSEKILKSTCDNAKVIVSKLDGLGMDDLRDYVPVFSALRPETLIFLAILWKDNENLKKVLFKYLDEYMSVSLEINGKDLIGLGHKPSPLFKHAFRECFFRKLEGTIEGKKQELDFTHKFLAELEREES
ncbi:MAG: hypothetical protein ABIG42_00855, partial [bacterium]